MKSAVIGLALLSTSALACDPVIGPGTCQDDTLTTLQVTRGPTGVGRATAQVTGTRRHPGRSLAAASVTARVVGTHTQVATTTATATLTGVVLSA